jgi:hypothetical protein
LQLLACLQWLQRHHDSFYCSYGCRSARLPVRSAGEFHRQVHVCMRTVEFDVHAAELIMLSIVSKACIDTEWLITNELNTMLRLLSSRAAISAASSTLFMSDRLLHLCMLTAGLH